MRLIQGNFRRYCRNRGIADVVGMIVGTGVTIMVIAVGTALISRSMESARIRGVGEDVSLIGDIALSYLELNYEKLRNDAEQAGGATTIGLDELANLDARLEGFAEKSSFGQPYRVCLLIQGEDKADLLVGTATTIGRRLDMPEMHKALTARKGRLVLGYVSKGTPDILSGNGFTSSAIMYREACGFPNVSDVVAYRRVIAAEVHGNQLYRTDMGDPELNTMKTDLWMGGKSITGVGELSVEKMTVSEELTVSGNAELLQELAVQGKTTLNGDTEVANLLGQDAEFANVLEADELEADELEATEAVVLDTLTAGEGTIADQLRAGSANAGEVTTPEATIRQLTATTTTTSDAQIDTARITGEADVDEAAINTLTVGTCNGC